MAKGEAKLTIVLEDLATKGIKGVRGALDQLRASYLAVTAAVAGVVAFAVDVLKSYAEQEAAIKRLDVALKNQGITSKSVSTDLVRYAEELQKITTFSDETIIETERLLVTFGLSGQQLKDTTKAALDLSLGLGIDLRSATLLLGKAFQGQTETLARYGIKIKEGLSEAERFEVVMGAVNQRFGGAAQAQDETFGGKIENLKNRFDDLKEKIGAQLLPVAASWLAWIDKAIARSEKLAATENAELRGRELTIIGLKRTQDEYAAMAAAGNIEAEARVAAIQRRLDAETAALKKEREIEEERDKFKGAKLEAEGLTPEDANRLRSFIYTTEEIKLLEDQAFAAHLQKKGFHAEAEKVLESSQTTFTIAQHKTRYAAARTALDALASLQSSKSKEMAAVGKAAAISLATIDTYAAATGAFKALSGIPFVGPVLAFAAAAAIMTAGFANVARIAGTPLAEGGVVPATSGGLLARVAEGGSAEAIIPLDDSRAQEKIRTAMGGDGPTINIYAGTIVADNMSIEILARRIDEEIFRLARNRESLILSPGSVTGT